MTGQFFDHTAPIATKSVKGLTLIIVAYHRPESLARLLGSAVGQAERVLVVNVENDPAVAKVAAQHNADVLALDSNPGYAAAVNTGAAAVSTPLVAFANDDLELAADCLDTLVAELRAGADVTVPRLRRPDGETEPSIARLLTPSALAGEWVFLPDNPPSFLPARLRSRLLVQKWRRPQSPEPVGAAEAALVATHTALLTRIPLPEVYFLYWEEHEWFHQLRRDGHSVIYVPSAIATHAGWGELSPAKSRLLARNAVRCLARTGGPVAAAVGWPVVLAWWARLWTLDALRFVLRRSAASRSRLDSRSAGLAAALGAWREIAQPHLPTSPPTTPSPDLDQSEGTSAPGPKEGGRST